MKAHDLKELTIDDLRQKEDELAEQLFALRLQKVTGQLNNPAKLRNLRRDLARVLTVAHKKAAGEGAES
ncbi:MAG: 50S ribosomal protein L29 [Acidobacteria bacterium]|nr:50S ribosomal protein L29 [Acidobacteriota bacterium]